MLKFAHVAGKIQHRGQKVEGLTAKKVHRPDRFQKQHCGAGHSSCDYGGRNSVEQPKILGRPRLFRCLHRKSELEGLAYALKSLKVLGNFHDSPADNGLIVANRLEGLQGSYEVFEGG